MLVAYNRPQFVEKIFTSPDGRQFRMVFIVALVNGELKGRLVSVQLLSKKFAGAQSADTLCLPVVCSKENEIETEYRRAFTPVVSPYNSLLFFTSQPTRAPSYVSKS